MATAKLIIGIVSIVLSLIVMFQSCAVGVLGAIDSDSADGSGGAGFLVSICMLVCGIVGIATRKSKGGGITTGIIFLVAALIGAVSVGVFGDLAIWAFLCLAFGLTFLIGSLLMKKPQKKAVEVDD